MDLTEAEDIKKRWQECTEELYKKDLQDPVNHDAVIIIIVYIEYVTYFNHNFTSLKSSFF